MTSLLQWTPPPHVNRDPALINRPLPPDEKLVKRAEAHNISVGKKHEAHHGLLESRAFATDTVTLKRLQADREKRESGSLPLCQPSSVSVRTMVFIAALASSVVEWQPGVERNRRSTPSRTCLDLFPPIECHGS
jgi:hypothetical protein